MGHHPRVNKLALLTLLLLAACTSSPTVTPTPSAAPATPAGGTSSPSGQPSASGQPTSSPQPSPTSPAESPTVSPTGSSTPSDPASSPTPPQGAFDPDRVALSVEQVASGYPPLTLLTNAGDGSGRIFLVQQRGVVVTIDAAGVETGQFMDISERIRSGGEQGLLGLAFHPDFESNGRLFVNYTNRGGDTIVSEFGLGADGNVDPATERSLLEVSQPYPNHNGGMIAFGPDGYFYIATGDGGSGGDPLNAGQNLNTMLGKMLRIDVDSGDPYAIPQDNPFADGGGLGEIWSYGLRNPWRFSFDRATGGMFIGDVGQNAREEIDVEPAGEGGRNYGWRIMEADRCYENANCNRRDLTPPAVAYGRDSGSCSVTGGYVYRGAQFPSLFGAYVFSDYCSGVLWAFDAESALSSGRARLAELGQSGVSPSSFGEDEAGEIYLVGHGGAVYRLIAEDR